MLVYDKQFMNTKIVDNRSDIDQVKNHSFGIYNYPLS